MVVKNTWPSHCPWLEDLRKEDAQEWAVEQTVLACQMQTVAWHSSPTECVPVF